MSTKNNQVNGTNTTETVKGSAAGEKVDAKPGADTGIGGAGDDWVKGGQGDDVVDGGAGSDRVDGNAGNDRMIYRVGENAGASDVYDGGAGTNTLVMYMTRAEWMRDGMQADIAALLRFLTSTAANATGAMSSTGFTFTSVGLQVKRLAALEVFVDGVAQDPRDEAIVALADAQTTATEHSVVTGNVASNDSVPDLLRSVDVVTGPAKGTLVLQTSGAFSYDPGMAFDSLAVNETATASFIYRVTDADRDSATATNTITITGTNDAPVAHADAATTGENTVLTVDVLANDTDVDASDRHVVDSVQITSKAQSSGGLSESKEGAAGAGGQGSVAIVANKVQWTPGTDFDYLAPSETAAVTMAYTQNDKNGGTSGSTLAVTVTGVNDAPTLQGPLSRTASEEDAPFTIDLLQGAGDVDRGAILNAVTLTEPSGKGGWVLDGNTLKITPHHFDKLNEGDTAKLTFNYKVRDQFGGEVAQTLKLDIEGYTDAPTLDAAASAGTKVNEIRLAISSQPAYDEQVNLRFSGLPTGASVLNAQGANVSAGVANFRGSHVFTLVLPAGTDADFDLGITVAGVKPSGEIIGSRVGAIDIVYDHSAAQEDITFIARNEGMWDSGPAPMVEWHEYIPLIGSKSQRWDTIDKKWVDTGSGAWHSGEFKLFSAQVDATQAIDIALGVAQSTLNTAKGVFAWASKTVDDLAQKAYDLAVKAFDKAMDDAEWVFNEGVRIATQVFNDTIGAAERAADSVIYAAYNTAVGVAAGIRDGAITLFGWMGQWVSDAAWSDYNKAVTLAAGVRDFALNATDWTVEGARTLAQGSLDAAKRAAQWVRDKAEEAADQLFDDAKALYEIAKDKAEEAAQLVLDGAQKIFDETKAALNKVQGKTCLDINADLYAEVGVQVDFILDSGSVDADVNYQLTSVLQHNRTTDTLLITPQLTNTTTGQSVAFDTISPNASLKAVLLYDVGVDLEVILDSYLKVAGTTLWDISPNANGVSDTTKVTTGGWGAEFETFKSGMQSLAGSINFDSIAIGSIDLLNLSTTNVKDIEVPLVGLLTEEIATVYVGIPTVETEGKAATWNPNQFVEGGLVGVDLSVITDAIMNVLTARIEFSPELRAKQPNLPSLASSPSLLAAVTSIGTAFLGTLFDALDGQSESTPIFLIDATEEINPNNLLHANLWPDFVIGNTVTADTAKFGFWKGFDKSNDLIRVVIDIDQAVAVIVNKIIEVAAAVGTSGSTLQFLAKLPDINPLDLEFGLEDLLKVVEAPQATIDEITKFFDLSVGFEAADFDVWSSLRFSQEFTLTVDDMLYRVTMEDGEKYFFEANDEGALKIPNASRHDANNDGTVDYAMELVPKAMFSNDTELGLTIGYVIDYLQATLSADLKLPLDELLKINIPGLPDIKLNLADVALGPLLRIQGDLDIASADVFEKRFQFDLGSTDVNGDFTLPETELVTVIGVDNTIVYS